MIGRIFLGRYEAVSLIGEGGMGRVYLARQLDLGRQVVVKVMHDHVAADPVFCERFQRETLLMARFQHPYAVTLYDASVNDPQGPCIVMEYIRGVTLDSVLQRHGRLPAKRVGRLLRQTCEVLQAAHGEGIVHRDLKPGNLMVVDPDTPYEMIKVMDFGLAKLCGPKDVMKITGSASDFAVGTPGYMCPEQARGEDMDPRGDLYSLGVILYELLSGRLPFTGSSTMDVMLAHATEPPPLFSQLGVSGVIPPTVEEVVLSCLAKDPRERPSCAREIAERFEAALAESEANPNGVPPAPQLAEQSERKGKQAILPVSTEPNVLVQQIEAWMPEMIASYKLRGFVQDVGGEVVESVPGRIRVRLGGRGSVYELPPRGLSWLLGRRASLVDLDLRLERPDPGQSLLRITATLRPANGRPSDEVEWQARGGQIFCDLRAYLMGQEAAAPVA